LAFDCEHVHLKTVLGTARVKAATVSVINGRREIVYEARIKHQPHSFIVNKHTMSKNGFDAFSLMDGKSIEKVQENIEKLFAGKLIIHY
jgi:hypothetical protein